MATQVAAAAGLGVLSASRLDGSARAARLQGLLMALLCIPAVHLQGRRAYDDALRGGAITEEVPDEFVPGGRKAAGVGPRPARAPPPPALHPTPKPDCL